MAKIIQFPAKSSNAYTNLEQLIAVSDSTASLEQYFEAGFTAPAKGLCLMKVDYSKVN